jgi:glycine/D-amino acid oxidase-like deaminating enzyme
VILPARDAPVELAADVNADFAIIGAGFAGLSAARRLLQLSPGARIAVLDAGRIAEGAAGRNSGFMIDLPHEISAADYSGQGVNSDREMIGPSLLLVRQLRIMTSTAPILIRQAR